MGVAERSVWENSIMSIVDLFCANYTKSCTLDVAKYSVKADYSSVSVLKSNETEKEDIIAKKINNLKAIKDKTKLTTSLRLCPASESKAKEFCLQPTIASITTKTTFKNIPI